MIFEVSQVHGEPREWGSPGREMLTYKLLGKLDGNIEEVQINTTKAKPKVPFVGEKIECEVAKDDPTYGKTIRRAQTAFVPSNRGQSAGGPKFIPSPATESPYLSLKAAVELAGYKIQAGEKITGADVVAAAKVFQAYIDGQSILPHTDPPRDAQQVIIDGDDSFEELGEYV